MNIEAKSRPINWRKFIWVGLILLIAGYVYGRPTLEKWTGLDLPALNSNDSAPGGNDNRDATVESDYTVNLPSDSIVSESVANRPDRTGDSGPSAFAFKEIGRNKFQSPAGLIYTMGPRGEHRIDHVMRHRQDNSSRPVHSVFDGDRDTILSTIDKGYKLIKSNSKFVKSKREGNRTEYTIDMQEKIGYEGGQSGKRKGHPRLQRLKLILQDKIYVVTAYPYR